MTRAVDPARRAKVLVVEDNLLNLELVRDILEDTGYEVLEAEDGAAGLRIAKQERPDLILMDIQLPGVDGLEITRRLRADPDTAGIPVLALTAHAMRGEQAKALEVGCAGFITKPIRVSELTEAVSRALEAGRDRK